MLPQLTASTGHGPVFFRPSSVVLESILKSVADPTILCLKALSLRGRDRPASHLGTASGY